MLALDGKLQLKGRGPQDWRIVNSTALQFEQVGFLHRTQGNALLVCWLAQIPTDSTTALRFRPADPNEPWLAEWQNSNQDANSSVDAAPGINLDGLRRLATRQLRLRAGDLRMIGSIADDLPGLVVQPTGSQSMTRTIVIAHLLNGPLPPPKPDENLLIDVQPEPEQLEDNLELMGQAPPNADPNAESLDQEQP